MGRKSKVSKLPPEVKAHIQRLLREDRLTLDAMLAELRARFPQHLGELPSRAGLGRYHKLYDEVSKSQKNIQTAAQMLVAELGEDFDDKSGALLSQAVTTLAINAVDNALGEGNTDIKDIQALARAARSVQEVRKLNLNERQAIAKEAREALLREQSARVDAAVKSGGLTAARAAFVREFIGGQAHA